MMAWLVAVLAKAMQIVFAQGLADPGEDVHRVVRVAGIVVNRRKNQAAIARNEQVPGPVGIAAAQLHHPVIHGHLRPLTDWMYGVRPSCQAERPPPRRSLPTGSSAGGVQRANALSAE